MEVRSQWGGGCAWVSIYIFVSLKFFRASKLFVMLNSLSATKLAILVFSAILILLSNFNEPLVNSFFTTPKTKSINKNQLSHEANNRVITQHYKRHQLAFDRPITIPHYAARHGAT